MIEEAVVVHQEDGGEGEEVKVGMVQERRESEDNSEKVRVIQKADAREEVELRLR